MHVAAGLTKADGALRWPRLSAVPDGDLPYPSQALNQESADPSEDDLFSAPS